MTASTSAWRRAGGQVVADAADADLGAVRVLGADVPVAAGVVADEHRAQAGHDPALPQPATRWVSSALMARGWPCRRGAVRSWADPSTAGRCYVTGSVRLAARPDLA